MSEFKVGERGPWRRALLRARLGALQMVAGLISLQLLARRGMDWLTITTLLVTCLLTPFRTFVRHFGLVSSSEAPARESFRIGGGAGTMVAILIVALSGSCRRETSGEDYAARVAGELSRRATPDGASVSDWSEPKRSGWKIQLTWSIRTHWDCGVYFDWVEGRLGADFEMLSSDENERVFVRPLHGDRHVLELSAIEAEPCSLKASFSTTPN